jgi:PAS domain S-box-containing protein
LSLLSIVSFFSQQHSYRFFFFPINYEKKNTNQMQQALDLDELFHDCYFDDLTLPEPVTSSVSAPSSTTETTTAAPPSKRSADDAFLSDEPQDSGSDEKGGGGTSSKPAASLTESQKIERRERNREHAKRSRLRKKFLLESLQEQIEGLQGEIQSLKDIIKRELPDRAESLLKDIDGGDNTNAAGPKKGEYTPLPMPSGFGPVKTLMEPDYRLMSALSGSQQNFAISDPSLPDNPIVYVSQGFLDLTGYTLDQVLGRNCRFLQGPGTDQAAVDVIRKGVREGTDTSVCLLNYKADGSPFWNQFFVAALRDAENNVVNFVGVQCEVSKAVVDKHIAEGKTPGLKK